jgi:hypothetical protein
LMESRSYLRWSLALTFRNRSQIISNDMHVHHFPRLTV